MADKRPVFAYDDVKEGPNDNVASLNYLATLHYYFLVVHAPFINQKVN